MKECQGIEVSENGKKEGLITDFFSPCRKMEKKTKSFRASEIGWTSKRTCSASLVTRIQRPDPTVEGDHTLLKTAFHHPQCVTASMCTYTRSHPVSPSHHTHPKIKILKDLPDSGALPRILFNGMVSPVSDLDEPPGNRGFTRSTRL